MMKYMGYPYPPEHPILLVFLIVLAITIYSIPGIIMAVVLVQMAALYIDKRFHISIWKMDGIRGFNNIRNERIVKKWNLWICVVFDWFIFF